MPNVTEDQFAALREVAPGQLTALRGIVVELVEDIYRASQAMEGVEALLDELGVVHGEAVVFDRVPITPGHDMGRHRVRSLAYGRIYGRFRLHVVEQIARHDGREWLTTRGKPVLWESCSKEVRLEAMTALPGLLDKLVEGYSRTQRAAREGVSEALAKSRVLWDRVACLESADRS